MAKILVADDVLLERTNVTEALRKRGHTVIEVDDGKKAVDAAIAHKPDAIIMDIVMPEMDGFAATKRIMMNPETKGIPIIIVSSKAQESDKFRANQLGAKGYLVKPVNGEELVGVLSKLI